MLATCLIRQAYWDCGKRQGQHSIRINQQWRICFQWKNGDCYDVEVVDYH